MYSEQRHSNHHYQLLLFPNPHVSGSLGKGTQYLLLFWKMFASSSCAYLLSRVVTNATFKENFNNLVLLHYDLDRTS